MNTISCMLPPTSRLPSINAAIRANQKCTVHYLTARHAVAMLQGCAFGCTDSSWHTGMSQPCQLQTYLSRAAAATPPVLAASPPLVRAVRTSPCSISAVTYSSSLNVCMCVCRARSMAFCRAFKQPPSVFWGCTRAVDGQRSAQNTTCSSWRVGAGVFRNSCRVRHHADMQIWAAPPLLVCTRGVLCALSAPAAACSS